MVFSRLTKRRMKELMGKTGKKQKTDPTRFEEGASSSREVESNIEGNKSQSDEKSNGGNVKTLGQGGDRNERPPSTESNLMRAYDDD